MNEPTNEGKAALCHDISSDSIEHPTKATVSILPFRGPKMFCT